MKYYLLSFFFCATCLNMMANDGRFIMYENSASSNGIGNRFEVPVHATENNGVITITSDSTMYFSQVSIYDECNNMVYNGQFTLSNSPTIITIPNVSNEIKLIYINSGNKSYIGVRAEGFIDHETAVFLVNRIFPNTKMTYYVKLENPDYILQDGSAWHISAIEYNTNNQSPDSCYWFSIPRILDPDTYVTSTTLEKESFNGIVEGATYTWTSMPYGNNGNLKPNISNSNDQNDEASYTYAIIYNAATDKYHNYEESWNDCLFLYQTLKNKFHVPTSHIKILSGGGNSNTPDMLNANRTQLITTVLDMDGDGQSDVLQANHTNLQNSISGFSSLSSRDHLLVFFTGYNNNEANTINLASWDGYSLATSLICESLNTYVNNIRALSVFVGTDRAQSININLSQNSIRDSVVTYICGNNERPIYCSDKPYTDFTYRWLCALNDKDIHANNPYLIQPFGSDTNNNGIVTMREAYDYAASHTADTCSNYFDASTDYIEDLAFNFIPHNRDLYMCDAMNDGGIEFGNTSNTPIYAYDSWNSPDIYLRNQNDGLQNPTHEPLVIQGANDKAYIYVRVSNKDAYSYLGSGQYLQLYWACSFISGIAKTPYPIAFPGGNQYYNSLYGTIDVKPISAIILPDYSSIITFEWSIPQSLYNFASSENIPVSFLAMISKDLSPSCTTLNDIKHYASLTQKLRTIAMKDISYVQVTRGQNNLSLILQKNEDGQQNYDYEIVGESRDGYADASSITITTTETDNHIIADLQFTNNGGLENEKYLLNVLQKDSVTGSIVRGMALEIERTNGNDSEAGNNNSIASVSYNSENHTLTVGTTNQASGMTSVRVDFTGSPSFTRIMNLPVGESSISFQNIDLDEGISVISIIKDGKIIDTRKIMQ